MGLSNQQVLPSTYFSFGTAAEIQDSIRKNNPSKSTSRLNDAIDNLSKEVAGRILKTTDIEKITIRETAFYCKMNSKHFNIYSTLLAKILENAAKKI